MFRKKGLDKRQREIWNKNHQAIYEAVREIEINLERPTVSKIKKQLKKHGTTLSERSIITHLQRAVENRELQKIGHVYSSKMKIIADTLYQKFIISEVVSEAPRLEGEAFNDFVSKHFPTFHELEQEYQRKRRIPFLRFRYDKKLNDLRKHKESVKPYILSHIRDDLKFIEKATEIKILSSKKLPLLNTYEIKATLARVLYYMLGHEREVAERTDQEFSLENFGLNIVVSFDPGKVDAVPSRPTLEEQIAEIEKMPSGIAEELGFDKERIKRLKRLVQKYKQLENS